MNVNSICSRVRVQFAIAVCATICSCHETTPTRQPQSALLKHWISRAVLHASGSPAANANVVVTDLSTHKEIGFIKTDNNGLFRIDVPGKTAALTATAEGEVAYIPSIDADVMGPPIRLHSNCYELRGGIELIDSRASNSSIRAKRFSRGIGDSFATTIGRDGKFQVCVPSAFYTIALPEELVQRRNLQFVPKTEALYFRTSTKAVVERVLTARQGLVPETAGSFVARLPSTVRVLGLAESNHGTRQFSDERTSLAIELARRKQFRLIMIEAGYGEMLAVDEYIGGTSSSSIDISQAVQQLGYWIWDTKTFLESLEQLKSYNASVPVEHRIHLVGFDVQTTTGAVEYLTHGGTSLTAEEVRQLAPLGEFDGKRWAKLSADERQKTRNILERLASDGDGAGAFSRKNRAMLAARSLLLRIEYLEAVSPWHKDLSRDAGISRMIVEVLALEPGARASLWAHLGHLSREHVIGSPPAGYHVAAKFGTAYQVYAFLAYSGSVRAWDTKTKIGVIPHDIPPAPADSVEATLFEARGGSSVTYWEFARAKGDAAQWLRGVHRLTEFGAVYPGDQNALSVWDLRSIDGAVLFDHVTPTVPTPTGERVAAPERP